MRWLDGITNLMVQSKGLSRVSSSTTVQKHQFFCKMVKNKSSRESKEHLPCHQAVCGVARSELCQSAAVVIVTLRAHSLFSWNSVESRCLGPGALILGQADKTGPQEHLLLAWGRPFTQRVSGQSCRRASI